MYPAEAATLLLPPTTYLPPTTAASLGPRYSNQLAADDHHFLQCKGSSLTLPYLHHHADEPSIPDLPLVPVPVPRKGWKLRAEVRRERRMVSNRESARRARGRKWIELGQLRAQLPHLRDANIHLLHRLNGAVGTLNCMVQHNSRLMDEKAVLLRRLRELHLAAERVAVGGHAESRMVAAASI